MRRSGWGRSRVSAREAGRGVLMGRYGPQPTRTSKDGPPAPRRRCASASISSNSSRAVLLLPWTTMLYVA